MPSIRPRRAKQLPLFDANGALVKKPRNRRRGVRLGRPPKRERVGCVVHATREAHDARHPVHVSMKRVKLAPSLRSQRVYATILAQLAWAKSKGVRVVHQSVQDDHLHLIVEGESRQDLSNQMRKLFSRIALAVNAVARRRGSLFRDRHHRVELSSPTQVRRALVYVLFNDRKHHAQTGGNISDRLLRELDDRSSIAWVEHWREDARPPPEELARMRARALQATMGVSPVSEPKTWLAQSGWYQRGGGPLSVHELPRPF